jgi:hypothetical protein
MIIRFRIFENSNPTYRLLHLILDKIEKVENTHNKDYIFEKIPINIVQKLIDEGANINVHDERNNYGSLLCMAVVRRDLNLIKCLIKNGANVNDVNSCGSTPIYYASNSDFEILKYLIDSGGNVNIANDAYVLPLHHALYHKDYENAILLLNSGSEINSLRWTMRNSIKEKNYEFQKILCERYPEKISQMIPEKFIHKDIIKKYGHLFSIEKYNL